jgi:hypothetical protein
MRAPLYALSCLLLFAGAMPAIALAQDAVDTDGDGLTDDDETNLYGTDPLDPDSDDDGLTDGEECLVYGTGPWSNDSDYDGLTDYDEIVTYGTDPINWDSDGGGRNDGYEVERDGTNPLDALDDLADSDGDGVSDDVEAELGTNPLYPDSDDDRVWDGEEVYTHGTDPLVSDSDGDGLSDGEELYFYNSDPLDTDTDDDGFDDLYESIDHDGDGGGELAGDCDDTNPSVFWAYWWYPDQDGDGWGDPAGETPQACYGPEGWVDNGMDCDDTDPGIVGPQNWFADQDGDGYGYWGNGAEYTCDPPEGWVTDGTDCDDNNRGAPRHHECRNTPGAGNIQSVETMSWSTSSFYAGAQGMQNECVNSYWFLGYSEDDFRDIHNPMDGRVSTWWGGTSPGSPMNSEGVYVEATYIDSCTGEYHYWVTSGSDASATSLRMNENGAQPTLRGIVEVLDYSTGELDTWDVDLTLNPTSADSYEWDEYSRDDNGMVRTHNEFNYQGGLISGFVGDLQFVTEITGSVNERIQTMHTVTWR